MRAQFRRQHKRIYMLFLRSLAHSVGLGETRGQYLHNIIILCAGSVLLSRRILFSSTRNLGSRVPIPNDNIWNLTIFYRLVYYTTQNWLLESRGCIAVENFNVVAINDSSLKWNRIPTRVCAHRAQTFLFSFWILWETACPCTDS